jgi:hypothetical protein
MDNETLVLPELEGGQAAELVWMLQRRDKHVF